MKAEVMAAEARGRREAEEERDKVIRELKVRAYFFKGTYLSRMTGIIIFL